MRVEKRSPAVGKSGMALMIVLAVIAVLSIAVIGFGRRTESVMEQARYFQDQASLRAMGMSGIEIGFAVLYQDRLLGDYDSLLEGWSSLESIALDRLFTQGSLTIEIVDLSGLFPINRLAARKQVQGSAGEAELFRKMLVRLLTSGKFAVEDEMQARVIVDSLADWLDSDDTALPFGAENGYYLAQEEPHPARNGPVEFIDELLQVRGMTPEILYGSDESQGVAEYINIYGNGRINLNTAPALVLQALVPGISETEVEVIDEFRRSDESALMLEKPDWYRTVAGWPREALIEQPLITTASRHFRVKALAKQGGRNVQATADVERGDEDIVIKYRSME